MGLKFRIIARMDIRNEHLIKTIHCEGVRKIGDPAEFIKRYDDDGIDEFYFNDCVASLYGRNTLHHLVRYATEHAFCPVTVAGGVRSEADVRDLLNSGADKVALNTAAVENPPLIDRLATKFGSSTIVLQLDAKRITGERAPSPTAGPDGREYRGISWEARTHGGRQSTGRDAVEWAREAVNRGVGEIVATSIDREGTSQGPEIALGCALATLPVPVVLAGGFRSPASFLEAYTAHASGVCAAGVLHYHKHTISSIKKYLVEACVPVRLTEVNQCGYVPSQAQSNP